MTPFRLAECLVAINWSKEQLAKVLGCDEALIEAWASGEEAIPLKAEVWLNTLAHCHGAAEAGKPKGLRSKK